MTIIQLKYAVETAECGSITLAAEKLFIAQPSLSKALHLLEEELGFSIFVRSRRGVQLSAEGTEFIGYARRVLEETDLLEERYGKKRRRTKRIAISTAHIRSAQTAFAMILPEFAGDAYAFSLQEESAEDVINDVASRKSELGVLAVQPRDEKVLERILQENELGFQEIYASRICVWMSGTHPLAGRSSLSREELPAWPVVSYSENSTGKYVIHENITFDLQFPRTITVSNQSSVSGVLKSVPALHIGGENCFEPGYGDAEGLVRLPLDPEEKLKVGIIRYQNTYLSSMGSLFLEELEHAGRGDASELREGKAYIRRAAMEDLPYLLDIYAYAKRFMKEMGNPSQWSEQYPSQEDIVEDIVNGYSHVIVVNRRIEAVFAAVPGKTAGYDHLVEGRWQKDSDEYLTIHRLASWGTQKGMTFLAIRWCREHGSDLRADTHENNKIIRHIMEKEGFVYCGKARIFDGSIRLVYQWLREDDTSSGGQ